MTNAQNGGPDVGDGVIRLRVKSVAELSEALTRSLLENADLRAKFAAAEQRAEQAEAALKERDAQLEACRADLHHAWGETQDQQARAERAEATWEEIRIAGNRMQQERDLALESMGRAGRERDLARDHAVTAMQQRDEARAALAERDARRCETCNWWCADPYSENGGSMCDRGNGPVNADWYCADWQPRPVDAGEGVVSKEENA